MKNDMECENDAEKARLLVINEELLDDVSQRAKESPRLRMNFNLHESLDAKAQRLLNALEPGTVLPVHRHKATAETYVLLRGRLKVILFGDDGNQVDSVVLDNETGVHGVNIPKNSWHSVEVLETETVILEVKDGPYTPLTPDNVLEIVTDKG